MREYSLIDRWVRTFDTGMRTLFVANDIDEIPFPQSEQPLTESGSRYAASLLRVNHAGEIAAQGLYQGQALTARLHEVREQMQIAAEEETAHLNWCATRLKELNSRSSYFDPFWYIGSVMIGAVAGLAGDRWSLGFVAETEKQVMAHLDSHLQKLPREDNRSRAIVARMREEEAQHASWAEAAGAYPLPDIIKASMTCMAKLMTTVSHYC